MAIFHTIPSYHLPDFQFLQNDVTNVSIDSRLLAYVTRDVTLLMKKMLSKED